MNPDQLRELADTLEALTDLRVNHGTNVTFAGRDIEVGDEVVTLAWKGNDEDGYEYVVLEIR